MRPAGYMQVEWSYTNTNTQTCARQPDGTVKCVDDGEHPGGFEWCINAPAVDSNGTVYVTSEDGNLYVLDQAGVEKARVFLDLALGAAYTLARFSFCGPCRVQRDKSGRLLDRHALFVFAFPDASGNGTRYVVDSRFAASGKGDPRERTELRRILRDEVRRRLVLRRMMVGLGCTPDPRRERKLDRVGKAISLFFRVGGHFFPMYGAARLESQNIGEYEHAARLTVCARQAPLADELLQLAEVEWDHELFFRSRASRHALWRVMPRWPLPLSRASIRERFAEFLKGDRAIEPVIAPWLVR
jgi:hypothetical protein